MISAGICSGLFRGWLKLLICGKRKKAGGLFQSQGFLVIREEPDNEPAVLFECFFIVV